jgi:AcrR family transcriptional regulator
MADPPPLPDDVALLWGRREPPRRGPKAALTVEEIVRAAVAIADAEGLGAVSMAKVAAELGNSTMALYRHIRSKGELLLLMGDASLAEPPDLTGLGWRDGLTRWATGIADAIGPHRWFSQLPITGPPVGPNNVAWFDVGLGALSDTGLTGLEKVGIVQALTTYVHGQIRLGRDLEAGYQANPAAFDSRYGAVLASVVDPARFPALSQVIAEGVFDADTMFEQGMNEDFQFGLELFLDGVAAYLERRRG